MYNVLQLSCVVCVVCGAVELWSVVCIVCCVCFYCGMWFMLFGFGIACRSGCLILRKYSKVVCIHTTFI